MRVIVIEGPEPIATPADVPGNHAADDARVLALIAAAQAEIDGPTGWLGRALGVQTLEARGAGWFGCLPYRPIVEILSVTIGGQAVEGVASEWDSVLHFPEGLPRGDLVVRYRAGYDGATTGKVPANAKAAVILMAQELLAQAKADGGLRSVTVDDVVTHAFNSPDMVQRARTAAVDRLLAPLRVFAL